MRQSTPSLVAVGAFTAAVLAGSACSSRGDDVGGDVAEQAISAPSPYAITIYRSDGCEGDPTAVVVESTESCRTLSATELARSVKVRGSCVAVTQRSVRWTCERYKQGSTVVFASDSCADDALIASISSEVDCFSFGAAEPARATISTGPCIGCDQCTKVSGYETVRDICLAVQWGGGP